MGNPSRQKIRIFDLEGLREVESKKFKFFMQKLKKQSISDTSKSKTYPFDDLNQRIFYKLNAVGSLHKRKQFRIITWIDFAFRNFINIFKTSLKILFKL